MHPRRSDFSSGGWTGRLLGGLLVLGAGFASARAHEGPRVWIGAALGTVVTHTSDNDIEPGEYVPSQLFFAELSEFFGIFTTDFPGFEVRQDNVDVPVHTTFAFNLTGPLRYYDEASASFKTVAEHFGSPAPGPVPQMAVSLGSALRQTGPGPVAGFAFFTFTGVGDHSHLAFTLLGNGTSASDGPTGVYAMSLELAAPGWTSSRPFVVLIGKGVSPADALFQEASIEARTALVGFYTEDMGVLDSCLQGPDVVIGLGCQRVDFDGDGDVDLADFAIAQRSLARAGQ